MYSFSFENLIIGNKLCKLYIPVCPLPRARITNNSYYV